MKLLIKTLVWTVVSFLLIALALFLSAGTVLWPVGWIYWSLLLGFTVVNFGLLFTSDPALLQERLRLSQPDVKTSDRVLTSVNGVLAIAWFILIPLDAVRFHWSHVPLFLQIIGAILLVGLHASRDSDLPGKRVPVDHGACSGRTGTNGHLHRSLSLCAP